MSVFFALYLLGQPAAAQSVPSFPAITQPAERKLTFNGQVLDAQGIAIVEQLEAYHQTRIPDGAYWYDPQCGASGRWGGPTAAILPPNLALGGPLPVDASGGSHHSAFFINGRALHAEEIEQFRALFGEVIPGRYFVDAQGNMGTEGGAIMVNLYVAAQQARDKARGGTWSWSHGTAGAIPGSVFVCDGAKCSSWSP